MNPGPTEEAGQAARSFIDALKDQPLSLALVVMNLLLLVFLYYNGVASHQERLEETRLNYENRTQVAQMLAQCYPGDVMKTKDLQAATQQLEADIRRNSSSIDAIRTMLERGAKERP